MNNTPDFLAGLDTSALQDQTVASKGNGGGYHCPPAGRCIATLVAYIEIGKHQTIFQGAVKQDPKALWVFELSGKNYKPREVNGKLIPYSVTLETSVGTNEKSRHFKLFTKLNYDKAAKHPIQLIGKHYSAVLTIDEKPSNKGDGSIAKFPHFFNSAKEYVLERPYMSVPVDPNDPECEEYTEKAIKAPAILSKFRGFLWDFCDLKQWASLYIDGSDKQIYQTKIKAALNYDGSKARQVIEGASVAAIPEEDDELSDDAALNEL